jgi:hypothetical protein
MLVPKEASREGEMTPYGIPDKCTCGSSWYNTIDEKIYCRACGKVVAVIKADD